MRKGEYRKVTVDDVTFTVCLKYGELKEIYRQYRAIPDDDKEASTALTERTLIEHVISIEGYEDATGDPITKLTEQEIAEFDDPLFLGRVFRAVIGADRVDDLGNPLASAT